MNPARHHTLNQTAHILDSTSHTQMYRPSSPLSSSTHRTGPASNQRPSHSHLSSPSKQPTVTSRPQTTKRTQNLHLPGLPRYHPANFLAPSHPALAGLSPSQNPSPLSTSSPLSSSETPNANGPPPRHQQRYTDAQRLRTYQRDILEQLHRNSTGGLPLTSPRSSRPTSPHLDPLGSPGDVVTPLELAGQEGAGSEGYLMARPRTSESRARESLEELIGREGGRGA